MKIVSFGRSRAAWRPIVFATACVLLVTVGLSARVGINQLDLRQDQLALDFGRPQWRDTTFPRAPVAEPGQQVQPSYTFPQPDPIRVE